MTVKTSPMTAKQALDLYFLDNRARMLEIASFLDRLERYEGSAEAKDDYRCRSFLKALELMLTSSRDRTRKIQKLFSDATTEPIDHVTDGKAYGAWEGIDLENY